MHFARLGGNSGSRFLNEHVILSFAGVGLLGLISQWLAWRAKIPAILFLLVAGIFAGPISGWLNPYELLGELLFPFVTLAVGLILFEGSLTLRLSEIRGYGRVVRNLVTVGSLISATVTGTTVHYLLGFSREISALFGALMVVTGPTVVIPMLRSVRPGEAVANVLRWEGIVIDPLGALFTVVVMQFIVSSRAVSELGGVLLTFGTTLGVGFAVGAVCGLLLGEVLRRHLIPEYLFNVAALNAVLGTLVLADSLSRESGLLAVTVMGVVLANRKKVPVKEILHFKETLSLLLISALFVSLAAGIDLATLHNLGWSALGVLAIMQFIGRPLKVWVSSLGSSLSWRERVLIAWIGPRGIVAAAIAALLALRLEPLGYPEAPLVVPLAFCIIIGTVTVQGLTARPLARLLKVAEPEPKGLLIIGANPVARAIGKALADQGCRVLLTDSSWENVSAARLEGLSAYHGNPVSEHADHHLDLVGMGRMLGLSYLGELNALAALRYRTEFGTNQVYTLRSAADARKHAKHSIADEHRGATLFGDDVSYATLANLLHSGGEIHSTLLSEDFGFQDFMHEHRAKAIPLFAFTPKGELRIFSAGAKLEPKAGWRVMSLVPLGPGKTPSDQKADSQ